jgi:hypothetical protein
MEVGYLNLLYIMKSANISLQGIHFLQIIIYLCSLEYFFKSLEISPKRSTLMTLALGFVVTGGEQCLYLLRQLLATSFFFVGWGLALRKRLHLGIIITLSGILFHSSSLFYVLIIFAFASKKKWLQISASLVSLASIFLVVVNPDLVFRILAFIPYSELISTRYETYESLGIADLRNDLMGTFSFSFLMAILLMLCLNFKSVIKYEHFSVIVFTLMFTVLRIVLESNKIFWLSSRINFVNDSLLVIVTFLTANKFLSQNKLMIILLGMSFIIFIQSLRMITVFHSNNNLFAF